MTRRDFLGAACATVAAAALQVPSFAQAQTRTAVGQTRIVVGFAAGGPGDLLARVSAEQMQKPLGAAVYVENRPGAAGRIAVDATKAAEPDGTTLLNSPSSLLTLTPHALRGKNYNPIRDLVPVATLSELDFALVVGPTMPVRNLAEFIQFCRANPKLASFGTAGAGTPQHMIGAMLSRAANVDLTHVAYRGGAPALQDTIGGTLPACIGSLGDLMLTAAREGRVRILATAGTKRSVFLPDVPVIAEEGFKSVVASDWTGLLAPARTPAAVVARLGQIVGDVVRSSEFRTALARFNMEPLSLDAKAYRERLEREYQAWEPIVKATGFTLDS